MDFFSNPDPDSLPTARAFIGRKVVVRLDPHAAEASTLAFDLIFMRRIGVRPLVVYDADERASGTKLVGTINRLGGDAVNIDGTSATTLGAASDADGNAKVRAVNAQLMSLLLEQGYIPVLASNGMAISGVPMRVDGSEAAGRIAAATHAVRLLFPSRGGGVPSTAHGIIDELTASEALELAATGTLSDDVARNLTAAAMCVRSGVDAAQLLDLTARHATLVEILTAHHVGTQVVSSVIVSR
jgi:acetylglutamate kinase